MFDSLDVEENVGLALKENTRMPYGEIEKVVAEKLELVGLPGTQRMKPADLSGGMKKRVALARALATNPYLAMIALALPATHYNPFFTHCR